MLDSDDDGVVSAVSDVAEDKDGKPLAEFVLEAVADGRVEADSGADELGRLDRDSVGKALQVADDDDKPLKDNIAELVDEKDSTDVVEAMLDNVLKLVVEPEVEGTELHEAKDDTVATGVIEGESWLEPVDEDVVLAVDEPLPVVADVDDDVRVDVGELLADKDTGAVCVSNPLVLGDALPRLLNEEDADDD